jgi:hypothetical protein
VAYVNFAGCSRCGNIVPLMCAGSFPMHMPMPVQVTPMGMFCGYCGASSQVFTCTLCGTMQMLYMPGMRMPTPGYGTPQYMAPVVQASQGASQHSLRRDLCSVALTAAKSGAGEWGHDMGDAMAAWMTS